MANDHLNEQVDLLKQASNTQKKIIDTQNRTIKAIDKIDLNKQVIYSKTIQTAIEALQTITYTRQLAIDALSKGYPLEVEFTTDGDLVNNLNVTAKTKDGSNSKQDKML
jgi:hypothetical protein